MERKRIVHPISILKLFCLALALHGGSPASAIDPTFHWVSRTLQPHFPLEGVRGIAESPSGVLWFASWGNGLVSYDGIKFTRYGIEEGLPSVYLRDCFIDRKSSLWIASGDGLIRMVGGEFKTFNEDNGFPLRNIYTIAEDSRGRVFVGGEGGTAVVTKGGQSSRIESSPLTPPDGKVKHLFVDSEMGILWESWDIGYIVPIDLDTLKPHSTLQPESFHEARGVRSTLRDNHGRIWVACDFGVFRQSDDGWEPMQPPFIQNRWGAFRMDLGSRGEIILATLQGVAIYADDGWSFFDHMYIPEANQINTVFVSPVNGSIWIGTKGRISVLHPSPFETLLPLPAFDHRMTSVSVDLGGRLWVGGQMLAYQEEGSWIEVKRIRDGTENHVADIEVGADGSVYSLWSREGIMVWRHGDIEWLPHPDLPDQDLFCLYVSSQDRIFVGTERDGVLVWDGSDWLKLRDYCPSMEATDLDSERIYSLFESSAGSIFIGVEGGLYRLQGCDLQRIPGPLDDTEYEVVDILETRPEILLVAISGLGIFELENEEWNPVRGWESGLDTNLVTKLCHGPNGEIWVGTKANGLYYTRDGGWFHLGLSAGLAPCQVESIADGGNGEIYFVSDFLGLMKYTRDKHPPQTRITSITKNVVRGEPVVLNSDGHDQYERTDSGDLRYSYRIDLGDWSSPSVAQPISIPAVPMGHHTIEVSAIDLDGNRDLSPAMDHFLVTYPWWRHPLTLILGFVLLLNMLLLAGFLIQRFRSLAKTLEERKEYQRALEVEVANRTTELRQVADFQEKLITNVSHDFRTPLTNLIGYAQMLGSDPRRNLDENQREFVDVIQNNAKRMKRLIENVAQSLQGEDPLERYPMSPIDLREIAFDTLKSHALSAQDQRIELDLVCGKDRVEITGSDVLVGRLLDNLVSNAIKFSNPDSLVKIEILQEEKETRLSVIDKGIGIHSHDLPRIFDRFSQVHRGLKDHVGGLGIGLSICKEIADYHRAEILVDSIIDQGSTFTVVWKDENWKEEGETAL